MTKVLVFEKDEEKATQLQQAFKEKGILCKIASTPKEVLRLLREDSRKILVLNYEQGGDDIAAYLASKEGSTPFYFISERIERKYKIAALRLGAEDYIAPLDIEELILKIQNQTRWRNSQDVNKIKIYKIGNKTVFDYERRLVTCGEATIKLTTKEAELMKIFCENINQVIPRSDMLQAIWGEENYYKARTMDVYITRLRHFLKIDESINLINHHGIGFSLTIIEQ